MKWPTPEAASPLPLKGATPAARQSPICGVRLAMHAFHQSWLEGNDVRQLS
jgi:hypothetical protein